MPQRNDHRSRGNPVCSGLHVGRLRTLWPAVSHASEGSTEPPKFLSHQLQSSMTRATVEESTAGHGQKLCGACPFWWVRPTMMSRGRAARPCSSSLARSIGGIQPQGGGRTTAWHPRARVEAARARLQATANNKSEPLDCRKTSRSERFWCLGGRSLLGEHQRNIHNRQNQSICFFATRIVSERSGVLLAGILHKVRGREHFWHRLSRSQEV